MVRRYAHLAADHLAPYADRLCAEDSYHKGRYAKFEATVLGGAHLN